MKTDTELKIIEQKLQIEELKKDIAHTVIHRMNLWQFIFMGGYFRKQYDIACETIIKLREQTEKVK